MYIYIIIAIDYLGRFIVAQVIQNEITNTVKKSIEEWSALRYIPETLITDNGKEFQNTEFEKMLSSLEIEHRVMGIEDHR